MAKKEQAQNWIISIANSATGGGATAYRVYGTDTQVKKHLLSLLREDKENDEEDFKYDSGGIGKDEQNTLLAYAVYDGFHIEYNATPDNEPIDLTIKKEKEKPDPVITVCYGRKRKWESREDALAFFEEAVQECDGNEKTRYKAVLANLQAGHTICQDENSSSTNTHEREMI